MRSQRAGPGQSRAPLAISGYAALFGRPDLSGDIIERGAFAASLLKRGAKAVRMLWHHDPARPVGRWLSLREDRTGLFVEGELAFASQAGEEAAALIESGALDGLSIGFRTKLARPAAPPYRRRLVTIDLWEVSLVSFPMQEGARLLPPGGAPAGPSFRPAGKDPVPIGATR